MTHAHKMSVRFTTRLLIASAVNVSGYVTHTTHITMHVEPDNMQFMGKSGQRLSAVGLVKVKTTGTKDVLPNKLSQIQRTK